MYFIGAKLALFIGDDLLVIKRDNRPDIPFPDCWDLPGGGREGVESPEECALRETLEEVGLRLHKRQLTWSSRAMRLDGPAWFFAAHRPASDVSRIRFGNEGQGWELMHPTIYIQHSKAVPHLAEHVHDYLRDRSDAA
ncbi:MAG: NUDIX hydrolase [Arenibacterium sp.]